MPHSHNMHLFVEELSDRASTIQALRASATTLALGTSLLIGAFDTDAASDDIDNLSHKAVLLDARRRCLELIDLTTDDAVGSTILEQLTLWKSVMTVVGTPQLAPTLRSVTGVIGLTLLSTSIQTLSLILGAAPAADKGPDTIKEAQRELKEARTLVAAAYGHSNFIDMMRHSAEELGLDHGHHRPGTR